MAPKPTSTETEAAQLAAVKVGSSTLAMAPMLPAAPYDGAPCSSSLLCCCVRRERGASVVCVGLTTTVLCARRRCSVLLRSSSEGLQLWVLG